MSSESHPLAGSLPEYSPILSLPPWAFAGLEAEQEVYKQKIIMTKSNRLLVHRNGKIQSKLSPLDTACRSSHGMTSQTMSMTISIGMHMLMLNLVSLLGKHSRWSWSVLRVPDICQTMNFRYVIDAMIGPHMTTTDKKKALNISTAMIVCRSKQHWFIFLKLVSRIFSFRTSRT